MGSEMCIRDSPCESNYAINIKLKLPIHKNLCLPIHIEIKPHLGAIWAPFWHQKSTEIQEYSPSKGIKNESDFYTNFYWILASFWGPCLSHVRHQETPKTAQEPPKMPSEGVWEASWSQEPPKRRPDPLQDSILDLQTSILVPPDLNFGRFLQVIWRQTGTKKAATYHS